MSSLSKRIADMSPLQVALAAQQVQSKLAIVAAEPVAIVGMSCRFPGAANPDELWSLLTDGREVNREVPADRWDLEAFYDPDPKAPGKMYTRRAAFLDRIDTFDPHFFGISPREARLMDPQQRLLLEVTWEALEDAFQAPDRLLGSAMGVFVGMCTYDFSYCLHDLVGPAGIDLYYSTGCAPSVAAGRLSYALGLTGPCMTVDTACSSALVAVHLACQSLRARECDLALAGGVSLMASPQVSIAFCKAGILSRDGHCRAFDEAADGYGRGEGCGMVALKRLADAVADGDNVLAIVRGSAVNQGGPSGGLTVPSGPSQQAVMRRALETSGTLPSQVGYVEAHATATRLGDPIEMNAIAAVMGRERSRDENPLFVGAVKTNIGHLEAASGIAAVIKVVLALRHGIIPAHLHFRTPSPFIDWASLPCAVPTRNTPWPQKRRIAGVNCFGYSGTNAHVLLEASPEAPPAAAPGVDRPHDLLVLSAKTREALIELAGRYRAQLDAKPDLSAGDVCHAAAVGRAHFKHRVAIRAGSVADMRARLAAFEQGKAAAGVAERHVTENHEPGVAFVFTGDGLLSAGTCRELYETHPRFRETLDRCVRILEPHLPAPLLNVLYPPGGTEAPIGEPVFARPALFALEYALAELWQSWGVSPRAVLGHGVGELVAACVAGVFGLDDALTLLAARGAMVERRPERRAPKIPLISSLTGAVAGDEILALDYWVRDPREPAPFHASLESLRREGCTVYLEIAPTPALAGMLRESSPADGGAILSSLRAGHSGWQQMLDCVGQLYLSGVNVDWRSFDSTYSRRLVALPTYPFERRRCWPEEGAEQPRRPAAGRSPHQAPRHPLLGGRLHSAPLGEQQILFESRISPDAPEFLRDHRVFGHVVLPAAAFLEIGLAAGAAVFDTSDLLLEDVTILQPLVLAEGVERTVQTLLTGSAGGREQYELRIFSGAPQEGSDPTWIVHATGTVRPAPAAFSAPLDVSEARSAYAHEVPVDVVYRGHSERGIEYGPAFRGVAELRRQDAGSLGRVELAPHLSARGWHLHPALLDGCFQTMGALGDGSDTYLPVGFERVRVGGHAPDRVWCRARIGGDAPVLTGELRIFDADGAPIAEIDGMSIRRADREALLRRVGDAPAGWLYEVAWKEKPLPLRTASPAARRRWLILERDGLGAELARALDDRGDECIVAAHVDWASPADVRRLVQESGRVDGYVYLQDRCDGMLHLAQALADRGGGRVWLATMGAQHAAREQEAVQFEEAPLWGLGRVIPTEGLGIDVFRVDLDRRGDSREHVAALVGELTASDGEDQVAYRRGVRHVARLARRAAIAAGLEPPADRPYKLQLSSYGTFDNLELVAMERRAPGPGEIEIEVRASGLNFRDLLHALAVLPQPAPGTARAGDVPLGFECSGVVAAVGSGVSDFAPGDEVIAMAWGAMSSFVTVPATHAAARPYGLSFERAAALPLAYVTAIYGLEQLARIRAGDRVLIHAAAGGVGQAALQVARRAGAEVFATASRGKWQRLRAQGVAHVMDSRSPEFADEILARTNGEGVDIVLNSLSGDFIAESLRALKSNGRFVELGAIGIWTDEQVRAVRPGAAYLPFNLGEVGARDPELIAAMLREVSQSVASGRLEPPGITCYPVQHAVEAFRHMASARHYGKIVLTPARVARALFSADATYLVTGGLGALGLAVARWLASEGARRIVLASRGASKSVRGQVEEIRALGVEVVAVAADVSQRTEVEHLLTKAHTKSNPLRGVFHLAGVLDDGALIDTSWERFRDVMAPKADGAFHLHSLTRDLPLDYFVCFSSASAIVGIPGQASYAAANAFVDALAHDRRSKGLPALAVNWGPWGEIGMFARMDERHRRNLAQQGFSCIAPAQGLRALGDALREGAVQIAVLPVDWAKALRRYSRGSNPPFFAEVAGEAHRGEPLERPVKPRAELLEELARASAEARDRLVLSVLQQHVKRILGLTPGDRLDPDEPLSSIGLDSLMGIELRSRIATELGIDIPLQTFAGAGSLSRLAAVLLEKLTLASLVAAAPAADGEIEEIAL